MSDDVRPGEVFEIEPENSGGLLTHLPWWLVAAAAFAVAELTAHPSIGVIVLCLKFGWNDFLTALWLRRRDPDTQRGATCSWFYFSSGLWRICIWSFVLLFATLTFSVMDVFRQAQLQQPQQQAQNAELEAATCLVVWLLSSAIATGVTLGAVRRAWTRQIKVWVSGSMTESRRRQEWPPQPSAGRRNQLRWWLVTTGMVVFLTLFTLGTFAVVAAVGAFGPAINPNGLPGAGGVIGMMFGAIASIVAAIVVLVIGSRIFVRIGAMTPADCWPELVELGYQTSTDLRRESLARAG